MLRRLRAVRTVRRRNSRISLVVDFAFQPQFANFTVSFTDQKITVADMHPVIPPGGPSQVHPAPIRYDVTVAAEFFGEAVSSAPMGCATGFIAMLVALRESRPVQQH
jgi:hypothetical protein